MRFLATLLTIMMAGAMIGYTAGSSYDYLSTHHHAWLSTPGGLAIYPVAFKEKALPTYFSHHQQPDPVEPSIQQTFYALSPFLATIIIYIITAALIYFFARMRRFEFTFLVLTISVVFYFLAFIDFLTHNVSGLFFLAALLINIPFINLFHILFEKPLKIRYTVLLTIFASGMFYFIANPQSGTEEILMLQVTGLVHLATVIYSILFMTFHYFSGNKAQRISNPRIRRLTAMIALLSLAIPTLSFSLATWVPVHMRITNNFVFFLPALFPIAVFIAGMRYGLIFFEVPIYGGFLRFVYFSFFAFIYWFVLGYPLMQTGTSDSHGHVILPVLILLLLVDPLRTFFYTIVNRFFLTRRLALEKYQAQSSDFISNPRQFQVFIQNLFQVISEGLNVRWVKLIVGDKTFAQMSLNNPDIIHLEDDHTIWGQSWLAGKARRNPVLTQAAIGPARDLLQSMGGFLIAFISRFNVAVVVSEKIRPEPFTSEDIKFIRTLSRQIEPLLENYRFLVANIELRRQERELEFAARVQRKILPASYENNHLKFITDFSPSEKVTGDYIDFFETEPGSYMIFLGDVSGHGLGSAYLMALIRSFIRGSILIGKRPLEKVFEDLNGFLSQQYRGSDFMTLFAINLRCNTSLKKRRYQISYINAGQHPAVCYRPDAKQPVLLESHQRVLGIVQTDYHIDTYEAGPGTRFCLFSDGAFEIFDNAGKMLGEQALHQWFMRSINRNLKDQLQFIKKRIFSHITDQTDVDDITLLMIELK